MHLRVVVARHAQPFDQFARRGFAARGCQSAMRTTTFCRPHVGIGAFREINVHRHPARVGADENLVRPDLGTPT